MNRYPQLILSLLISGLTLPILSSCDHRIGETIESAYTEVVWQEPTYRFKRNDRSSVQSHEVEKLVKAVDRIHSSYLRRPDFQFPYRYKDMMAILHEGLQSMPPIEMVATSDAHRNNRTPIRTDIHKILDDVAQGAGHNSFGTAPLKQRAASKGLSGYVGINIGDDNVYYVDHKGLNYATLYQIYMVASIYIDQILNVHLLPEIYDDLEARKAHEQVELMPGGNYTSLEHHWDLAYAYYQHCRFITDSHGTLALRDSHRKIHYAFVQGRIDLGIADYKDLHQQLQTIRTELSKAVAIQAIYSLLGPNTQANINDEIQYAFSPLTKGYALIYALQFTRTATGEVAYTYQEIKALQELLIQGDGFWDKERLLAPDNTPGSLISVAKKIAELYQLDLSNITR